MGANFTYIPTWVTPIAPKYAVIITQSESFKKDYQLLDTNSIQRYTLKFEGVSDTNRNLMIAHYSGVTGPYDSFSWTTVPSYLNEGASLTVRYSPGGYREKPDAAYWNIDITFEKNV